MKAHPDIDVALARIILVDAGFIGRGNRFHGKLSDALDVVGTLVTDEIGYTHVRISDCFH